MKLKDRLQAASKFITRESDEIDNMFREELSVKVKISDAKQGTTIMFSADSEDENEEWALTSNWVFRIQYEYIQYSSNSFCLTGTP